MNPLARLIFPSLRWRARTGYRHEQARIDATLKLGVGGYIIFGGNARAARELTTQLQQAGPHPLLIGSDFERGAGQQLLGLTHLPSAAAIGFLDDPEIARRCGEITAREARSVGINWVYAPVGDLDNEPANPIVQTRSMGDDPERVGRMVAAWVKGAEGAGVASSIKHYPGHGRTTADSHDSLPDVAAPLSELEAQDLVPFREAIRAGARSVMAAHVAYPAWDATGTPATLSPAILGYLRSDLGFDGVIVTDALIMEGALKGRGEARACVDAVRAGCDALLYPMDAAGVTRALSAAARDAAFERRASDALGRIGRLADAVKRGTGDWGLGSGGGTELEEHRRFAAATADISIHTLRGDSLNLTGPVLPVIVDDDVGGPYSVGSRRIFASTLRSAGVAIGPRGSRLLLVYSEPRSWKGHAMLSPASVAAITREAARASLIVLFGHPRLVAQIPGETSVICAWHGQPLMQEAVARWVAQRLR